MDTSPSFDQQAFAGPSEVSSLTCLLERGIDCTRQGRYVEGAVFLERARQRLSPDQTQLAAALDAFIHSHTNCWQAQQELLMASKRFVEAETEHQTHLLALEKLLPTLEEDTQSRNVVTPLVGVKPQAASQPYVDTQSRNVVTPLVGVRPQAVARSYLNTQSYQTPESARLLSPDTDSQQLPVPLESSSNGNELLPALQITCFGHFEVRRSGKPIALCSSRKGQSILRYLVAKPGHCATIDMLQAIFWPEDEPDVARHKVQVAVSTLRRSLNNGHVSDVDSYILCKNRVYQLNPVVSLRSDVDEFLMLYQSGRQSSEAAVEYERACQLYTGPFLVEDMYADWSFTRREQLSQIYLTMCGALAEHYLRTGHYEDAAKWATAILKENRCDEAAHRQLMQIYAAQGRRCEALQQYRHCERLLREELSVQPMPETVNVLQTILAYKNSLQQ